MRFNLSEILDIVIYEFYVKDSAFYCIIHNIILMIFTLILTGNLFWIAIYGLIIFSWLWWKGDLSHPVVFWVETNIPLFDKIFDTIISRNNFRGYDEFNPPKDKCGEYFTWSGDYVSLQFIQDNMTKITIKPGSYRRYPHPETQMRIFHAIGCACADDEKFTVTIKCPTCQCNYKMQKMPNGWLKCCNQLLAHFPIHVDYLNMVCQKLTFKNKPFPRLSFESKYFGQIH